VSDLVDPPSGDSSGGSPEVRDAPEGDFWIEEHAEENGRIRLGLVGELDVAGADQLHEHLQAVAQRGAPLLLDLRRLQFIDSSGLGELVRAVSDARREGRTLEIDATLSPQVRQVIELLELQPVLWPTT
jgi:anti-anti-sigma factor